MNKKLVLYDLQYSFLMANVINWNYPAGASFLIINFGASRQTTFDKSLFVPYSTTYDTIGGVDTKARYTSTSKLVFKLKETPNESSGSMETPKAIFAAWASQKEQVYGLSHSETYSICSECLHQTIRAKTCCRLGLIATYNWCSYSIFRWKSGWGCIYEGLRECEWSRQKLYHWYTTQVLIRTEPGTSKIKCKKLTHS